MILVEKPIGGVWFFWLLDWLVASKFTWGVLSRKEDSIQREKCHYWTIHQELHVWMMSLAPSVAISHKTLSSVLSDSIWQCFLVKSRVFLFCCLGMFIPHLQKSHPLNTWKLRHPSSSQLWAAPKTKKRNIWHACNAQKKCQSTRQVGSASKSGGSWSHLLSLCSDCIALCLCPSDNHTSRLVAYQLNHLLMPSCDSYVLKFR